VLLLLGVYHMLTYSVSTIRHLLADITNLPLMLDILRVLLPFGIGVIVGGLTAARIVGKLLRDFGVIVYLIILGLMLGSVYALLMQPILLQSGVTLLAATLGAVTFTLGCAVSYMIGKKRL
jgi:putative membrane protein